MSSTGDQDSAPTDSSDAVNVGVDKAERFIVIRAMARYDGADRDAIFDAIRKALGCDDTEDDCPMHALSSSVVDSEAAAHRWLYGDDAEDALTQAHIVLYAVRNRLDADAQEAIDLALAKIAEARLAS